MKATSIALIPLPLIERIAMVLVVLFTAAPAFAQAPEDFDLEWNTIDCGGGVTEVIGEEETWSLDGTIGQFDAGFMSTPPPPEGATGEDEFTLEGGFWPGMLPPNTCAPDLVINGTVDVDDLLAVITSWGACALPCPPNCAADIAPAAGNCDVNVDDLLAVITNWGSCP